jgi:hypothetical protein
MVCIILIKMKLFVKKPLKLLIGLILITHPLVSYGGLFDNFDDDDEFLKELENELDEKIDPNENRIFGNEGKIPHSESNKTLVKIEKKISNFLINEKKANEILKNTSYPDPTPKVDPDCVSCNPDVISKTPSGDKIKKLDKEVRQAIGKENLEKQKKIAQKQEMIRRNGGLSNVISNYFTSAMKDFLESSGDDEDPDFLEFLQNKMLDSFVSSTVALPTSLGDVAMDLTVNLIGDELKVAVNMLKNTEHLKNVNEAKKRIVESKNLKKKLADLGGIYNNLDTGVWGNIYPRGNMITPPYSKGPCPPGFFRYKGICTLMKNYNDNSTAKKYNISCPKGWYEDSRGLCKKK